MSAESPQRIYLWFIRCLDRSEIASGGAYARCYVKASDESSSLHIARRWIEEDTGFEPSDEVELLAIWEQGQRPQDIDEIERLDEAWSEQAGSLWLHTWDESPSD